MGSITDINLKHIQEGVVFQSVSRPTVYFIFIYLFIFFFLYRVTIIFLLFLKISLANYTTHHKKHTTLILNP